MFLFDVNVLLFAFRSDAEHHERYRIWLESIVNSDSAYGMSPQVLSSVIRIATHPSIFPHPSRKKDAIAFANVLLGQPNCQKVEPGPRHWDIFTKLCTETRTAGNLVPDAWFAALAIESGCEWISTDGDYRRFNELRTRAPF
jgi:toxin-antitoxin system PIN domain toxin